MRHHFSVTAQLQLAGSASQCLECGKLVTLQHHTQPTSPAAAVSSDTMVYQCSWYRLDQGQLVYVKHRSH